MFCHKCGSKLSDNAAFCTKCGIKILSTDIHQNGLDTYATQTTAVSVQELEPQNNYDCNKSDFKRFIDNHIQATTEFQSAEELLNSNVPLWKVWVFPAIPALWLGIWVATSISSKEIEMLMEVIITVLCAVFFYVLFLCVPYFVFWLKRSRYATKFSGKFEGDINTDEIISFLDENLNYLFPYFNEWGVLSQSGYGVKSCVMVYLETSLSESLNEVRLCSDFGSKTNLLTVLYLRPDILDKESGVKEYFVNVKQKLSLGIQFSTYTCVYKTAPILQATMEYYLNHYRHKNNNILADINSTKLEVEFKTE